MMSKLKPCNHLSQKKYQLDLSSVLILGKLLPVLLQEDTFTGWLIMANDSTAMVKEIISMDWKDSGDF